MKKLRLNKIFHWLYAFLMFFPIIGLFGGIIITSFNNTFSLSEYTFEGLSSVFWDFVDQCTFEFNVGTTGLKIRDIFAFVVYDLLGSDDTGQAQMVVDVLAYWTSVSFAYLVFDVVMLPINIAHYWIDKGSDRL